MDVRHKRVYGYLKIPGVKEPHMIDCGGIAATLAAATRLLFDSRVSMRGEIEIIISTEPRRPDSELTPGERASKEFVAQHGDLIEQASDFDELLANDETLLEYWRMCLTQKNFDVVSPARREQLTQYVAEQFVGTPIWHDLAASRENLVTFGAAGSLAKQESLFTERDSNAQED